jgi:cell wall-associated NlpC family hydrolase
MFRLFALIGAIALTACASSGATPQPFPGNRPSGRSTTASSGRLPGGGYGVSGTALSLRGSPYRNGGSDPTGFDCSGFVSYVFAQHGYSLPRSVGELFRTGREIPADAIQPGDLVFFNTSGAGASHVGIVIGGDQFVHAPSTSGVVRVDRVSASYWAQRFVAARRVD